MPEGDTIHRTARTLRAALVDKTVLAARSNKLAAGTLIGRSVRAVEAHGKHLLIYFDDGRALHSHMRMTGSWHLYRPGERFRRSEGAARIVLEVSAGEATEFVAVCFSAPVVELVHARKDGGAEAVDHLGPDVLSADFDETRACALLRIDGARPIGDAIMDQTRIAGVGNIYKSETLFVTRVDPRTPVAEIDDPTLFAIVSAARRLMSSNMRGPTRTTTSRTDSAQRFWVYRRAGRPCLRCGTTILVIKQGDLARTTYFCPSCQNRAP
jgi:endonuclease-8